MQSNLGATSASGTAAPAAACPPPVESPEPEPYPEMERRPPPEVREEEALFDECMERLMPHGLGIEEIAGEEAMREEELDELLKNDLGYSVLERNKIKAYVDFKKMERRADEKNRAIDEQMDAWKRERDAERRGSDDPDLEWPESVEKAAPPGAAGAAEAAAPAAAAAPPPAAAGGRDEHEMAKDVAENERLVEQIGLEHVPEEFLCPITGDIMADPVVTVDGHVYEREGITAWLSVHDTSPNTGSKLESKILIPNIGLRRAIATWKSAVKDAQLKGALPGGPERQRTNKKSRLQKPAR